MEQRKKLSFDLNSKDITLQGGLQYLEKVWIWVKVKEINEIYLQFSLLRIRPEGGNGIIKLPLGVHILPFLKGLIADLRESCYWSNGMWALTLVL